MVCWDQILSYDIDLHVSQNQTSRHDACLRTLVDNRHMHGGIPETIMGVDEVPNQLSTKTRRVVEFSQFNKKAQDPKITTFMQSLDVL
jgi:hypothetical protein